jgi:putative heme degradation protein
MSEKREDHGDREAIIYVAAMVPFLLWGLALAYLRMRWRANKEGRQFFQALVRDGVPRDQARELADMYSSSLSLRQLLREMPRFTS